MSTTNVGLINSAYAAFAKGDVPSVIGTMSPNIVWMEAENFPYADHNPYVGPDAIVGGVFTRLATEWDGFAVKLEDVLDAGDHVVTRGRYTGAYKATGKPINAQFAHVWKIVDGKVSSFQQYVDTLHIERATRK